MDKVDRATAQREAIPDIARDETSSLTGSADVGPRNSNATNHEGATVDADADETGESVDPNRHTLGEIGGFWVNALQKMMRSSSRRDARFTWGQLGGDYAKVEELARTSGCNVIHLEFSEDISDGPRAIILAAFRKGEVLLYQDCELWMHKDWTSAEIITHDRRFKFDEAGHLKGRSNNLDEMRARRVLHTNARWRVLANELVGRASEG